MNDKVVEKLRNHIFAIETNLYFLSNRLQNGPEQDALKGIEASLECLKSALSGERFTFFWSGPFSQWHPCEFIVDRIKYNCAEQFMMASKARTFSDDVSLQKIMETNNPQLQKSLGRKVSNFDESKWNEVADGFVFQGNIEKFNQNLDLLKKLFDTSGTTLVEASPYDKIWGIGLAEHDPRADNRATWLGQNRLGEVLTKVRETLLDQLKSAVDQAT